MQAFGFAGVAGDEAHIAGVGRVCVVANSVQHPGSLAHQIGIRGNAEAHQRIRFEHFRPGGLRGELCNGVAAEKRQHGVDGGIALDGEGLDPLAECRPLLTNALRLALGVDPHDILGGIP